MSARQQAREAWEAAQQRATAAFTWPMEEPRPDPSKDPDYPYSRKWERRVLQEADMASPVVIANWAEKRDDFNPDTNARLYVLKGVPEDSGEGAIYTPEYLQRRSAGEA